MLPQPTTHIIDWFHIAMKIQPLQQVADHFVRWHDAGNSEMAHVDANVRSLKWKLWHGQTDRALDQLERMTSDLAKLRERGNLSATRLLHLAQPLQTYVRSNKSAIINYGARYRSGRRIATALLPRSMNSLGARRMVKKQTGCNGQSGALIFYFRFGPPFSTAIFASASRTSRRNKPIDRGSRGCSSRHRRCSRRLNTPANLSVPPRRQGGSSGLIRAAYDNGGDVPCLYRGESSAQVGGSDPRSVSVLLGRIFCSRRLCPPSREKRRSWRWLPLAPGALQGFVAGSRASARPCSPTVSRFEGRAR